MITKRIFPNVKQAIEDLREDGMKGLITSERFVAKKTISKDPETTGRWIIFDKGMGCCKIEKMGEKPRLIRLSMESAVAAYLPADRVFSVSTDKNLFCKVLYAR